MIVTHIYKFCEWNSAVVDNIQRWRTFLCSRCVVICATKILKPATTSEPSIIGSDHQHKATVAESPAVTQAPSGVWEDYDHSIYEFCSRGQYPNDVVMRTLTSASKISSRRTTSWRLMT